MTSLTMTPSGPLRRFGFPDLTILDFIILETLVSRRGMFSLGKSDSLYMETSRQGKESPQLARWEEELLLQTGARKNRFEFQVIHVGHFLVFSCPALIVYCRRGACYLKVQTLQ